jgi:hypothetical protein
LHQSLQQGVDIRALRFLNSSLVALARVFDGLIV